MNATGSVLVDTNVVVAYFRGEKALAPRFLEAATLAALARQHDLPLATRDAQLYAGPSAEDARLVISFFSAPSAPQW